MALKEKVPCPRCDGKGVIPQYFYNRKGICFLCWGSKFIYVKVPAGVDREDYMKDLREKERIHLSKNPPKVPMPDANKHRNKAYFKDAKTKLKVSSDNDNIVDEQVLRNKIRKDIADMSIKDLQKYIANAEEVLKKASSTTDKRKAEILLDELKKRLAEREQEEVDNIDEEAIRKNIRENYGDTAVSVLRLYAKSREGLLANTNGSMKDRKEAEIELDEFKKLIAEKEEEAKPKTTTPTSTKIGDYEIGQVIKGTRGKPDITIIDGIGGHVIGEFKNTKTGKTQYTVFPSVRMERDEWQKYQDELKKNVGGVYSRYLAKQLFDENPSDKVKAWVNGGGRTVSIDDKKADTGKDDAYKKRREERENRRKSIDIINRNDGTLEGYKRIKAELEALGDYKGKADDIKWVDDAIKKAEERDKEEALKKPIKDVLGKHGNMYYASLDELKALKVDLEALPESDYRNETIAKVNDLIDREIKREEARKKQAEEEAKVKEIAIKQQTANFKKLQERKEMMAYNVTDKIKDTALGNSVKERIKKGVTEDTDVIDVGNIILQEYKKNMEAIAGDFMKAEAEYKAYSKEYADFHDNEYLVAISEGDMEKATELQKKLDEMTAKKKALSQKVQDAKIDEKEAREKAYLKTMQEVRELGFKKGEKLNTGGNTTKTKAKIVEKHMKYFPREWVEASNHTPLEVIFTTKDPYKRVNSAHHNSNYEGLVQVSRKFGLNGTSFTVAENFGRLQFNKLSGDNTYTHEIAHRMETINPKLVSFEAKFFERRTKGSKPRKLRDATGLNYADHEIYFPLNDTYDGKDWVEYYMGKPYKWDNDMINSNMFNQYYNSPEAPEKPKENDYRAFEIFTMGMEQLVHGARTEGKSIYESDDEMAAFILGLLATS